MKKITSIIIACILLQGCAIHFQNQKGVEAKGKDFKTKIGKIEKGKAHYWSEIDVWLWFPWKMDMPKVKSE